jgi:crotonobetainyl-CoA:carnitine CoA-transferase CaiB-like acyl-CoA transferase
LEESALAALANQASNQLMEGHTARPMGTLHPNISPYGEIVSSKDGVEYILAIGTQVHFEGLCEVLNCPELISDWRFASNQERVKHRAVLHELLQTPCQEMSSSAFEQACRSKKVPVGRIRSMDEVVLSEAAKAMTRDEVIEGHQTSRLSSIAFQIDRHS